MGRSDRLSGLTERPQGRRNCSLRQCNCRASALYEAGAAASKCDGNPRHVSRETSSAPAAPRPPGGGIISIAFGPGWTSERFVTRSGRIRCECRARGSPCQRFNLSLRSTSRPFRARPISSTREWREEFIYFLMVDRFHDDSSRRRRARRGPLRRHRHAERFLRRHDPGITAQPRLHRRPGLHGHLALAGLREQSPRVPRLRHQQLPRRSTPTSARSRISSTSSKRPTRATRPCASSSTSSSTTPATTGATRAAPYDYSDDQRVRFRRMAAGRPAHPARAAQSRPATTVAGKIRQLRRLSENQHGDIFGLKDYANDDDPDRLRAHQHPHPGALLLDPRGRRRRLSRRCGQAHGRARLLAVLLRGPRVRLLASASGASSSSARSPRRRRDPRPLHRPEHLADGRPRTRCSSASTPCSTSDSPRATAPASALRDVLKGTRDPQPLIPRLEAQRNRALNRGEIGRYLVAFVDNHDSFWQPGGRFANGAPTSR